MSQSVFPTLNSPIFIPGLWRIPASQSGVVLSNLKVLGTISSSGQGQFNGINVKKTVGTNNFVFGYNSFLNPDATCYDNFVTGANIASGFSTGNNNVFVGCNGYSNISSASSNTSIGSNCGIALTTGNNNTLIGKESMFGLTTGNNNTALGHQAGDTLTTGLRNTFLGANSDTTIVAPTQSTAVGYGATITGSNQVVLGTSTESVIIPRNIRYLSPPLFAYAFTSTQQSIPNATDTLVNFPTADARNSAYTGLTYSAGTFTNSNSYSIGLSVSTSIGYTTNSVGSRIVFINTSGQGRIGMTNGITNSATEPAVVTTSANFVLNAGETFTITCFQNTGGALNIGFNPSVYTTRCSVMVF